jgi:transposase-like protein
VDEAAEPIAGVPPTFRIADPIRSGPKWRIINAREASEIHSGVNAVRLVVDTSRPIAEVAREIGVHEGTLGNWVNQYRAEHAGDEPPLTLPERARLRELERENRELRMKTEFLGKAAAFFAQEYR